MLWFFANDFEVYWYVCGQHSTAYSQPAAAAPSYSPLVLLSLLHRYEALTLVLWYVAYILFMTKNEAIFKWVDKKLGVEPEASTSAPDREKLHMTDEQYTEAQLAAAKVVAREKLKATLRKGKACVSERGLVSLHVQTNSCVRAWCAVVRQLSTSTRQSLPTLPRQRMHSTRRTWSCWHAAARYPNCTSLSHIHEHGHLTSVPPPPPPPPPSISCPLAGVWKSQRSPLRHPRTCMSASRVCGVAASGLPALVSTLHR